MKLDAVGEFGLIDMIDIPACGAERPVLGIGDDCAVLPFDETRYQLASCDLLVEDVHFVRGRISAYQLGYKAVAVNLSDVAAMGGAPSHILLSLALPAGYTVEEWQAFYRGVADICRRYGVNVIGGDTTSGEKLTVNVTVLGLVEKKNLHLRRDAKPGDVVFVTGALGASRAGLELVLRPDIACAQEDRERLLARHCTPEPCCAEIALLNRLAGAALHGLNDISDGLLSECNEIAAASGVAVVLQKDAIPVDAACARLAESLGESGLGWALTGGEDYQLVGTMDAARAEEVCRRYRDESGREITIIGTVEAGAGVYLEENGERRLARLRGYDHFAAQPEGNQTEKTPAPEPQSVDQALLDELARLGAQEEEQRLYRHDLQNHLLCAAGLLECGQTEAAAAYLRTLMGTMPAVAARRYSARPVLDVLAGQKARLAEARGIEFQLNCEDALLDFLDDHALCALLGNLLDNGLEHSGGVAEPYLYLDVFADGAGAVHIRMENSCKEPPRLRDGRLESRKQADESPHGYGMAQAQRVAERFGGRLTWRYDDAAQRFLTECVFAQ